MSSLYHTAPVDAPPQEWFLVPHPRMHERRFVLVPLAEIAPGARHPVLGLTAAEMLRRCPDRAQVQRHERSLRG
jgi:7,8-dihydro-6-hydroxymethylpterin-pyrophosphokinase